MSPAVASNDAMVAGRFARWALMRLRLARIVACLSAGGTVMVSQYNSAQQYEGPAHVGSFRATKTDLYVKRGRRWDCITHSLVRGFK